MYFTLGPSTDGIEIMKTFVHVSVGERFFHFYKTRSCNNNLSALKALHSVLL